MADEINEEVVEETNLEPTDEVETPEPEDKPQDKQEEKKEEKEEVIETREKKEEKIDYGEDIDPEDAKTIGSIVEKQTASMKKAWQDTQDKLEISNFIKQNPDFSKYENQILKYYQHPAYSQIPVKNIANMLAANDLMKIGAERERAAQAKADATKTPGNTTRSGGTGTKDWTTASREDFEAQKRRVLGQSN